MEEARQHSAMTPGRYRILILGFTLVCAAGLFWLISPTQRMSGPTFHAAGWNWIAPRVEWVELSGRYSVNLRIAPARGQGRQALDPAFYDAICGGVLTKLPQPPNQNIRRGDIYRVSVGFMPGVQPEGVETIIPVTVIDGACQPPDKGDFFSYRYPGELAGWTLQRFLPPDVNSRDSLTVIFERRDGNTQAAREFTFQAACVAVVIDPPQEVSSLLGADGAKTIRVKARVSAGSSLLSISRAFNQDFTISGRACIAASEGRAA